jgi:hypothetical protein
MNRLDLRGYLAPGSTLLLTPSNLASYYQEMHQRPPPKRPKWARASPRARVQMPGTSNYEHVAFGRLLYSITSAEMKH